MGVAPRRFEVYLVNLGPAVGDEIRETRPCLVISPDEMNRHIRTVIVAPMTIKMRPYPMRVRCRFRGQVGQVVLDQLRTVGSDQLIRRLGRVGRRTAELVLGILQEMFAP